MGNTSFTNCRQNTLGITEANERISLGHNCYASACTVCLLYGQKQNNNKNSDLRADGRCDSSTIYRGRGRDGRGGSGGEAP